MRIAKLSIAVALTSLLWAAADAKVASAQAPVSAAPAPAELEGDAVFLAWRSEPSVQRCGVCHYSPGNLFAERDTDFCDLTELKQWLKHDKHAIARQRIEPIAAERQEQARERIERMLSAASKAKLEVPETWIGESNFLSFAICKQLGYDLERDEGYAEFRKNCLSCHGGYESDRDSPAFARDSTSHPGIGCIYCHQVGDDQRWIDEHSGFQAKTTWRTLPPAAKADKGMRDLVSADAQSKLCLGCHVGDLKRNMFVTHAMYAAGHPPLPSVELSTLIEAMPPHWRSPAELYQRMEAYPQRAEYFAANFPALSEATSDQPRVDQLPWNTSAMITGALASQQQSLQLLVRAAQADSKAWGDYALYDCAACHHELRVPSARQAARRPGAPGRPRMPEWPQALTHAAEVASGQDSQLASLHAQLVAAFTQRPFGNRAAVSQAATQLDEALEQLKQHVSSQSLSDAFSRQMLGALADTPEDLLVDYHAARQVNWAIRCIDAELERLGKPLAPEVRTAISALGVGPTTAQVSTALPHGLKQSIYPEFVQAELARQANYDSREFRKQLQALSALLRN